MDALCFVYYKIVSLASKSKHNRSLLRGNAKAKGNTLRMKDQANEHDEQKYMMLINVINNL